MRTNGNISIIEKIISFISGREKSELETMINHSKSVRLGIEKSAMIVDMPFNTYRNSKEALKNAKLVMRETKCDGVKLEGGKKIVPIVRTLVKNGIPVMGHVGILPHFLLKEKNKKKVEKFKMIQNF